MLRSALLPALLLHAGGASAACTCKEDYPYCWSSGSGHDNRCYKSETSSSYSRYECDRTCTGSYSPAPSGPTPPPTPRPTFPPGSVAPPCDTRKSGDEYCADFCNYQCGFYNTSVGETGKPMNMTVIRITPKNVTGPTNKNTADAPGDVSFVLSKKNITQQCLHDPRQLGCNTDVEWNDLYGTFVIEVDGQWGPYQMCNPADGWDTNDWMCGMDCMHPSHEYGCQVSSRYKRNGTSSMGGHQCWCDRTLKTAGREPAPGSYHHSDQPSSWPPQCKTGAFKHASEGYCVSGEVATTLHGWDFASASTMACKACVDDQKCTGWAIRDGWAVDLFHGQTSSQRCSGGSETTSATAVLTRDGHHYNSQSWSGIGDIGGIWYSHTAAGECAPGKPLGHDGCTWRVVKTLAYKNATCVDKIADLAVEKYGKACFDSCPQPLNRFTDCYLDCYRNTLLGDASLNISKPPPSLIVDPWKAALEGDGSNSGCPEVQPGPMNGYGPGGGRVLVA